MPSSIYIYHCVSDRILHSNYFFRFSLAQIPRFFLHNWQQQNKSVRMKFVITGRYRYNRPKIYKINIQIRIEKPWRQSSVEKQQEPYDPTTAASIRFSLPTVELLIAPRCLELVFTDSFLTSNYTSCPNSLRQNVQIILHIPLQKCFPQLSHTPKGLLVPYFHPILINPRDVHAKSYPYR